MGSHHELSKLNVLFLVRENQMCPCSCCINWGKIAVQSADFGLDILAEDTYLEKLFFVQTLGGEAV